MKGINSTQSDFSNHISLARVRGKMPGVIKEIPRESVLCYFEMWY
jgi:hypothetical protein